MVKGGANTCIFNFAKSNRSRNIERYHIVQASHRHKEHAFRSHDINKILLHDHLQQTVLIHTNDLVIIVYAYISSRQFIAHLQIMDSLHFHPKEIIHGLQWIGPPNRDLDLLKLRLVVPCIQHEQHEQWFQQTNQHIKPTILMIQLLTTGSQRQAAPIPPP